MRKIVIDTNVVISATYSPNGKCSELLNEIFADIDAQIIYNQEILDEYKRVLAYKKFNFDIEQQEIAVATITNYGENAFTSIVSDIPLPDESDRVFYDTAKESGAMLITGNIKHYPEEDFIKTPAEYLEYIKRWYRYRCIRE